MAARRAVLRWAWRLFRREWRQQILVLSLLTVAVATATFFAAFAYNVTVGAEGRFGSADHRIQFIGSDPAATAADIAAAARYFGTIDVIMARSVRIPGATERLELRLQDPHGPYGAPMLALRQGRYPRAAGEVAVTDEVAQTLAVGVGESFETEGQRWTVVGLIENPGNLDDEFALVPPGPGEPSDLITILVDGDRDRVESFRATMTVPGNVARESRTDDKTTAAVATLILATVGLLLVALIAAAGFVVMAQRRMRQLGMLAAIGATERQVRLVTVLNGVLVGVVAAALGTAIGVAAWAASEGSVEEAAGHRISGLSVPPWLIGVSVVLAIATAAGAAWWPARAVARLPILSALSMRPPRSQPAHRSALAGVILITIGIGAFGLAHQEIAALIIVGTLATPVGVLLIAPLAVRAIGGLASRLPVAGRLALRDLGRYQARSGAALAAISLALGVPVAVIVVAASNEHTAAEGNLSDSQLMIRVGDAPEPFVVGERSPAEIDDLDARVGDFAAGLDDGVVIPLEMAVDPDVPPEPGLVDAGEQQAVGVGWRPPGVEGGIVHSDFLLTYVATPQVFDWLGADPDAITAHDVFAADTSGEFFLVGGGTKRDSQPVADVAAIGRLGYSSVPHTFVSPRVVEREGWERVRAGWFVEARSALTSEQRAAARELAVDAGLTIETRDRQTSLATLQSGATGAGILLALGVLAMTVGLIRSEGARDLRTLSATGASSTIRRTLTAATAGSLAVLGVALGVVGAYLVMIGAYLDDLGQLRHVPVFHLAVMVLGVPLLAIATGWLLAGRQPPLLARQPIE